MNNGLNHRISCLFLIQLNTLSLSSTLELSNTRYIIPLLLKALEGVVLAPISGTPYIINFNYRIQRVYALRDDFISLNYRKGILS